MKALSDLSSSTASGPDNIPPLLISRAPVSLLYYLCLLFNFSLRFSYLPQDWRCAKAIPLHKGHGLDKTRPDSYRLISITSIVARLLERIIFHRLFDFTTSSNFFSPFQAGFRPEYSTRDHLFRLISNISSSLAHSSSLSVLFFDISKAFDTVSHDVLIARLISMGAPSYLVSWSRAFLSNRSFYISSSPSDSSPSHRLGRGVPQGCVLSPLFFIIYINPLIPFLLSFISVMIYIFADDIAVHPPPFTSPSSSRNLLTLCMRLMYAWCVFNGLKLNANKSALTTFRRLQAPLPFRSISANVPTFSQGTLSTTSASIFSTSSSPYLGMTMESSLSWSSHFNNITRSLNHAYHNIGALISATSLPAPHLVASLISSTMYPKFMYCFEFIRLDDKQHSKIDKLLAAPLRRLLRLPPSVPHLLILALFGLPSSKAVFFALIHKFVARSLLLPPSHPSHQQIKSLLDPDQHSDLFPSNNTYRSFISDFTIAKQYYTHSGSAEIASTRLFSIARSISLKMLQRTPSELSSSIPHFLKRNPGFSYSPPSFLKHDCPPAAIMRCRLLLANSAFVPLYHRICPCCRLEFWTVDDLSPSATPTCSAADSLEHVFESSLADSFRSCNLRLRSLFKPLNILSPSSLLVIPRSSRFVTATSPLLRSLYFFAFPP